ncbi:SDR family NAD(P)-dependent oxidoreductase [Acinetobacter pittii]|uniref:SDR family NAD(P)-dependent oxidoreductase n=1 Tax=Acinetobacter pittii TaxID=48296 RepID=UPI0030171B9C
MARFIGKTALVTGAGGGIGSATARRLAEEGATVIVADAVSETAEKTVSTIIKQGGKAETLVFDLTNGNACRQAIADVEAKYGYIDILVNNAGAMRRGDLLHTSEADCC